MALATGADRPLDMSDVGHSTTGPAGRHTSRTLKSLSMEGKVWSVGRTVRRRMLSVAAAW